MLNHEGLLLNASEELACAIESLPWLPPPRLHIVDAAMVPVLELLPPRISSAVGKRLIAANGDVPLLMGGLQRKVMCESPTWIFFVVGCEYNAGNTHSPSRQGGCS